MGFLELLKAIFKIIPALEKLIGLFQKKPQQKIEEKVGEARNEIDEFKRTGRPPQ